MNTNNASFGQKFLVTSPGHVVLGVCSANDPNDPSNNSRKERLGALNFVGAWNPATQDYDFQAGSRIGISYNVSDRGLLETDVAQLKDGRILDVWRGSNTTTTAGHKWFSVSTDGGLTLSPVQEWKYDDGTSFYSPSSVHRFIRLQGNGKLYWIGNISPTAPSDNSPRYPLIIAEVDEDKVALKKNTVTKIIDKQPGELSSVQYSNFSVLENPETHQIELFMTNIGALGSTAPEPVERRQLQVHSYGCLHSRTVNHGLIANGRRRGNGWVGSSSAQRTSRTPALSQRLTLFYCPYCSSASIYASIPIFGLPWQGGYPYNSPSFSTAWRER